MDRVDDDIRETMHIYSTHTQKNTTLLKLYISILLRLFSDKEIRIKMKIFKIQIRIRI